MDKYIEIKTIFEKNANLKDAVDMSKYMRDMFKFYGIKSNQRKLLYRDIIKEEKKTKTIDWNLLDKCYSDEHREFQYFVNDYLNEMKKYITYEDIPKLMNYIKNKQWWDTIDFQDKVIGSIGLKDNRVNDLMIKWSTDEDIWLRRIAIDHQLGRKDKTNKELLEIIIKNNFGSKEFFINKAIGWSLRDYSKVNPKWVEGFLKENRDKMDKLSIKEASKYIKLD